MKRLGILLPAFFVLHFQFAFSKSEKEIITVYLPIQSVDFAETEIVDSSRVFLTVDGFPFSYGFQKKEGHVFQRYDQETKLPPLNFGLASFIAIEGDAVVFEWKKIESLPFPKKGDLVKMEVEIEKPKFKNIFFNLARNQIHFLSVEGETLFHSENSFLYNGPGHEFECMVSIQDDLKHTATEMRKQMEPVPISGGYFSGRELFNLMDSVKFDEILNFLRYVEWEPELYRGWEWKISEIFATWVVNGAPMPWKNECINLEKAAKGEEFNGLLQALNPTQFELMNRYLNLKAEAFSTLGKYPEAKKIAELSLSAAIYLKDPVSEAWARFTRANILLAQGGNEYSAIESEFRKSAEMFHREEYFLPEINVWYRLGMMLMNQDKFAEAVKAFDRCGLANQLVSYADEPSHSIEFEVTRAAFAEVWKAECLKALGKFKGAEEIYFEVLDCCLDDSGKDDLRYRVMIFYSLDEIEQKRGHLEDAEGYRAMASNYLEKLSGFPPD